MKPKRVLTQTGLALYIRWKGTKNRFTWKLDNIGYILRKGLVRNIASIFTVVFEFGLVTKVVNCDHDFPATGFRTSFRRFDRTDLLGKLEINAYFFFCENRPYKKLSWVGAIFFKPAVDRNNI